jgi:hypothetical protein
MRHLFLSEMTRTCDFLRHIEGGNGTPGTHTAEEVLTPTLPTAILVRARMHRPAAQL